MAVVSVQQVSKVYGHRFSLVNALNNISFDKKIFVKYTIDQWKTFSTLNTYYSMHYSDNNTDTFQFKLTISKDKPLTKISFVICYCANGQEYWDNNYSRNYNLEIIEK